MISSVRPEQGRPEDDRETGLVRRVCLWPAGPRLRLADVASNPQREERRHDAHHEEPAPGVGAERWRAEDDRGGYRRHHVAERPSRLHDADGFVAKVRRPRLADQHGAGRPLAAHADPEHGAPEQQLHDALRRRGAERRQREDQDRGHQGARPAEAIGHVAEDRAADAGHDERHRAEHAGRVVAESEVHAQLADGHGVEHEVHGVEHPAELRGQQHAPLLARDRAIPRNVSADRRRRSCCPNFHERLESSRSVGSQAVGSRRSPSAP